MMTAKKKHCERPRSCDDLVDLLMSDLMIEHLAILAHMTEDEFELFYDEVAGHIIEEFDLWTGNDGLLQSCLFSESDDDEEPDPARVILKKMREQVREGDGLGVGPR